jgi:hypothetical protein
MQCDGSIRPYDFLVVRGISGCDHWVVLADTRLDTEVADARTPLGCSHRGTRARHEHTKKACLCATSPPWHWTIAHKLIDVDLAELNEVLCVLRSDLIMRWLRLKHVRLLLCR